MTTKKKDRASDEKSRVKVGKLQVNKETVEDLTAKEAEQIKGGAISSNCQEPTDACAMRKVAATKYCE